MEEENLVEKKGRHTKRSVSRRLRMDEDDAKRASFFQLIDLDT